MRFRPGIGENLTWFWTVKALRIFSYGILILSRGLISDDIKRIEKVVPGMLTGNRFGGFATPLGAVIFFQELLLYLTMYQKPPSRLPDLWPVIISALSCGVFILFYIRMVFSGRSMDGWWTDWVSDTKPIKLFDIHGNRINRATEEKIRKSICQSTKECRRKKDAMKILKMLPFKQRFVDHDRFASLGCLIYYSYQGF